MSRSSAPQRRLLRSQFKMQPS